MRRFPPLAIACALVFALLGAGPALASDSHHHHAHHHATAAKHTSTTTTSSSTTTAPVTASGKATTKDGLTVLNDCQNHGQLTHQYPVAWLRKAESMMSSDTAQYSNCSTVIRQAILHSIHGGSGGSSSSGTTTIVIIVVVVLVILAALLGVLALRRRRGGGGSTPTA